MPQAALLALRGIDMNAPMNTNFFVTIKDEDPFEHYAEQRLTERASALARWRSTRTLYVKGHQHVQRQARDERQAGDVDHVSL